MPPPPCWLALMDNLSISFQDSKFARQFRTNLRTWVSNIGQAADHDDSWWASNSGIKDEFLPKLESYSLSGNQKRLLQYLDQKLGAGAGAGIVDTQAGFYLTPNGRRAYHEVFTIVLASSLFLLWALKLCNKDEKTRGRLDSDLESCQDICVMTALCLNFLGILEDFAFCRGPLPLHIEWYLGRGNNSSAEDPSVDSSLMQHVEDTTFGEEQDISVIPELAYAPFESDLEFPVETEKVHAFVRWLRLTTFHQHSVYFLMKTDSFDRIHNISFGLIRTPVPEAPSDMESLQTCLAGVSISQADREQIERDILTNSEPLDPDLFTGTYHCEAVLLSLYLSSKSGHRHPSVPDLLRYEARRMLVTLCTVSTACCPICATLYTIAGFTRPSTPGKYSSDGCCLPPWLPREYAAAVAAELDINLQAAVNQRIKEMNTYTDSTGKGLARGSQSPVPSAKQPVGARVNHDENTPPPRYSTPPPS